MSGPLAAVRAEGADWPVAGRPVAARADVEDVLRLGGWLFELRAGAGEAARASVRAELDARIADGLAVDAAGRLDPADAVNATIAAGRSGRSPFWRARYVETGRRLVRSLADQGGGGGPPDLARREPHRFQLDFRRTFQLTGATGPLRLRLPLPVEDGELTDLTVRREDGATLDAVQRSGRLELKLEAGAAEQVTLGVRLSFTARRPSAPEPAQLSSAEADTWLRGREGVLLVSAEVRALAGRLAPHGEAEARVHAFRDHLLDAFGCGLVPYEQLGDDPLGWVLRTGWFDCRLGALLLVALCRASSIPARLVGGYLLWDAPSEHYWMEAWLPGRGWTPFDLLAWDLSAGGADRDWRGLYAGALDHRMKTQVFPDVFTGAPGVAMGAWRRLPRAIPGGAETRMISADDGRLLYTDELRHVR